MSNDLYAWWREAVDRKTSGKAVPPVNVNEPQPGRYRRRTVKDGPWHPAAIWDDHGKLHCTVGVETRDAHEEWTWLAKNPVSEVDYHHRITTGVWPGEAPPIGDNRPTDPYAALCQDIKDAISSAAEWLKANTIKTQADADIAGNKIGTMRELAAKAKAAHKEEKEPHLRAGQVVDARYNPMIADLTTAAGSLKDAASAWAAAEQRKRDDEARKVEAERRRVDEENRKAAAAAALANAPPPPPVELPPVVEVKKVQIGGQTGRKVGFKTVEVVVITDYTKALKKYKDCEEIREVLRVLASHEFKVTGKCPAFCELKEEVKTS